MKKISIVPLAIFAAAVSLIGILLGIFYANHISLASGVDLFFQGMFNPNDPLFFLIPRLGRYNLRLLFIIVMGLVLLSIRIVCRLAGRHIRHAPRTISEQAVTAVVCVYVLTLFCQVGGQIRYLMKHRAFLARTTDQKYNSLAGEYFRGPVWAQQLLPPGRRYTCQLLTDMDISQDPGMLKHRMLSYFFYPVDLRNVHGQEPNCIFAFDKDKAASHVPPEYVIIKKWDDRHLLAILKDTL